MKICVWDSETTGLPDFKLPADHESQPHICEIAAVMVDDESEQEIEVYQALIRPAGWDISEKLTAIHGITTAMCELEGVAIDEALGRLHDMMNRADATMSYGFLFDDKMRRGACRRNGLPDLFGTFAWACIQRPATAACKMPATGNMAKYGRGALFKTPKLSEAVEILLGRKHDGAHRALADARAAAAVLFAARKAGHLATIKYPGVEDQPVRETQAFPTGNPSYETVVDPHARQKADSGLDII